MHGLFHFLHSYSGIFGIYFPVKFQILSKEKFSN